MLSNARRAPSTPGSTPSVVHCKLREETLAVILEHTSLPQNTRACALHKATHRHESTLPWGLTPKSWSANRVVLCSSQPYLLGQLAQAAPLDHSLQVRKQKPHLHSGLLTGLVPLGSSLPLLHDKKYWKSQGSTCFLWQMSFLCSRWKLRAVSYSSQPLLWQCYSHSQQISQPALILASKSRTYMPILKSRSNLYSWGVRAVI